MRDCLQTEKAQPHVVSLKEDLLTFQCSTRLPSPILHITPSESPYTRCTGIRVWHVYLKHWLSCWNWKMQMDIVVSSCTIFIMINTFKSLHNNYFLQSYSGCHGDETTFLFYLHVVSITYQQLFKLYHVKI